ncbi:MAG: tetratricopeptide repeat protein [Planctomycetota bacterium]|jgi:tetratricopeptide (TPR) repeat protein
MSTMVLRSAAAGAVLCLTASMCGCADSEGHDRVARQRVQTPAAPDPEQARVHLQRGIELMKESEIEGAIGQFTRAIRLDPTNDTAWYNRGYLRDEGTGELRAAIDDYTKAVELNPGHLWAINNRANCYTDLGEYDLAIAEFTTLLGLEPEQGDIYYNRAMVYHEMHEYGQALDDYNTAIRLNSEDAAYWENRGLTYHEMGKHKLAVADYTKAIELDARPETYFNRGTPTSSARFHSRRWVKRAGRPWTSVARRN